MPLCLCGFYYDYLTATEYPPGAIYPVEQASSLFDIQVQLMIQLVRYLIY
ncbi:MAG UNVERIFIED_CONTAM: hypothetical protein LVR29_24005 [Microcystis novacekii LVE1205-3]